MNHKYWNQENRAAKRFPFHGLWIPQSQNTLSKVLFQDFTLLVRWGRVPSCMNHIFPKSGSLWIIGMKSFSKILTYRPAVTVPSMDIAPIIPRLDIAHETVTSLGWRDFSIAKWGFSVLQMRQFCLLTNPSKWKRASPVAKPNLIHIKFSTIVLAKRKRCSMAMGLNGWWVWIF